MYNICILFYKLYFLLYLSFIYIPLLLCLKHMLVLMNTLRVFALKPSQSPSQSQPQSLYNQVGGSRTVGAVGHRGELSEGLRRRRRREDFLKGFREGLANGFRKGFHDGFPGFMSQVFIYKKNVIYIYI